VGTFTVEGTSRAGFVADLVPDVAANLSSGVLESKDKVQAEIDYCLSRLRELWAMEPDQAMLTLSAISARLSEMCVHLFRVEGRREWKQVRTQEAERALAECDRQWKTASRMLEVRRQDLDMSRG
jgi:hypothetical protein